MAEKIENPFKYSTDPELYRIFDSMMSLQLRVAEKFAKAEKIAGLGELSAFAPLQDVKFDLPNYRHERDKSSWIKTPLNQIENLVRPAVKLAYEKIAEVEQANKALDEQNAQLISQIRELMTRVGIPASYTTSDYPTARSRVKKTVTHTAGYIGDLERARPKSNVSAKKYQVDSYLREFEIWIKAERDAELKAKVAKDEAAVQKNILGNPTLVATLMQAGVNILEEVQKAVPGQKSEVIDYCKAQAIANVRNRAEIDLDLISKIQSL